ncbi:hypothetical protein CcCBS67573_g10564 [Chytriomyces confervae]|uniref:F-box domain-containing protein n=1 Tax=Chytriomyces confervae TaxID=246404 RepID=A0A507CR48_9FUNG|nr:hypothetical protein CcCBS67573_g10564 [Chytriomyces confervae]
MAPTSTSENATIQTSVAPTGRPDSQENRTMQITPDINSLPIELISCVFRWIPVQHVFKFRRLCRTVNDSLLTTQFALLNMQLRSTHSPHQSDASMWLLVPEKYQAAMAREKLSQLEILDSCGLVKTAIPFPKSVVLLSKLTTLNLSRCALPGVISDVFGALSNLTKVFLSNNQLVGGVPASFNCLSSLYILDLSKNRLTGHLPDFSDLNALKYLLLSENQLTGPIPTRFGSPGILQLMDVGRNLFSSIPATISNLVNVSYLNISYNPISSPIPKELWSLINLVNLEMCHCGLTGSLTGIGALSRLEELDACFNDLTEGIPPNEIPQMRRLKSLHLIGNPRLSRQAWDFGGLENFEYLCMDRAVLESSTLCGAFIPCELHGESEESQDSDADEINTLR